MSYSKNKLQSNSRLNREDDFVTRQSFNVLNLKYYTVNQACDFLRSFDLTIKSLRQNLLNHFKSRQEYISPIKMNLIQDNIALLEFTFEYTVWF